MRIAILTSVGVTLDAFFVKFIEHLVSKGHTVVTAAGTPSSVGEHRVIDSITRRPSVRNVSAPLDLQKWIKTNKVDVLITNTATASALARITPTRVPIVYFCHGLHWNDGRDLSDRTWQFIEKVLLRRTAGVLTINSDDERWFRTNAPSINVHRLFAGVGVPLNDYPLVSLPSPEPLQLLWAGELSPRKRPKFAIDVISRLVARGVDVKLVMMGEGPLRSEVERYVIANGLDDEVMLVGHGDLPRQMVGSHALLHTAAWEGLPRVGLEALAMGRRTIAFDVKGVRDLPEAFLAADGDVAELANLVQRFDPRMGLETNRDALDVVSVADEVLKFLQEIVKN